MLMIYSMKNNKLNTSYTTEKIISIVYYVTIVVQISVNPSIPYRKKYVDIYLAILPISFSVSSTAGLNFSPAM